MRFRAEVLERRLGVRIATDQQGAARRHQVPRAAGGPLSWKGAADTSQTGRTVVADTPPMSATLVRPRLPSWSRGYMPLGADVAAYVRYRSRSESLARMAGLLSSWPAVVGRRRAQRALRRQSSGPLSVAKSIKAVVSFESVGAFADPSVRARNRPSAPSHGKQQRRGNHVTWCHRARRQRVRGSASACSRRTSTTLS